MDVQVNYSNLRLTEPYWKVSIVKGNDGGYAEVEESYMFSLGVDLEKEIAKVTGYYRQVDSIELVFSHEYIYEDEDNNE